MVRLIKEFRLDEISAVDYPAQEGARALIMKRDDTKTDLSNKEADVADIAEITKRAEAAEAQVVELTKRSDELAKKLEAVESLAKRADDEILKVGETEIRKSAVGAEMFAFAKAQDAALTKAREEGELATLAKRASTEFGALPGTDLAKAKILKAAASMPEDVAKALTEALAAGNAAMKLGFEKRGVVNDAGSVTFSDKVSEIQRRDGISKSRAFEVAAIEFPGLVEDIR